MGIFKSLKASWAAATTTEKINLVLDILCGLGAGSMAGIVGKDLAIRSGSKLIGKVTIPLASCGLGIAAGNVASKALMESVGEPIGKVIDRVKEKSEKKEESEDGKHTRY